MEQEKQIEPQTQIEKFEPRRIFRQEQLAEKLKPDSGAKLQLLLGCLTPERAQTEKIDSGHEDMLIHLACSSFSLKELYGLLADPDINSKAFEHKNRRILVDIGVEIASRLGKSEQPYDKIIELAKIFGGEKPKITPEYIYVINKYFASLAFFHPENVIQTIIDNIDNEILQQALNLSIIQPKENYRHLNEKWNNYGDQDPDNIPFITFHQLSLLAEKHSFSSKNECEKLAKTVGGDHLLLTLARTHRDLFEDSETKKLINAVWEKVDEHGMYAFSSSNIFFETVKSALKTELAVFGEISFLDRVNHLAQINQKFIKSMARIYPEFTLEDPFFSKYIDRISQETGIRTRGFFSDSAQDMAEHARTEMNKNHGFAAENLSIPYMPEYRNEIVKILEICSRAENLEDLKFSPNDYPVLKRLFHDGLSEELSFNEFIYEVTNNGCSLPNRRNIFLDPTIEETRFYGDPEKIWRLKKNFSKLEQSLPDYSSSNGNDLSKSHIYILTEMFDYWEEFFNESSPPKSTPDLNSSPMSRFPHLQILFEELNQTYTSLGLNVNIIRQLEQSFHPIGHINYAPEDIEQSVSFKTATAQSIVLWLNNGRRSFFGEPTTKVKTPMIQQVNGENATSSGTLLKERASYQVMPGYGEMVSFQGLRIFEGQGKRTVVREFQSLDSALDAWIGKRDKEYYLKAPFPSTRLLRHPQQKTLVLAARAMILAETADNLIHGTAVKPDVLRWLFTKHEDKLRFFLPKSNESSKEYKEKMIKIINATQIEKYEVMPYYGQNGNAGWTRYEAGRSGSSRRREPLPPNVLTENDDNQPPIPPLPTDIEDNAPGTNEFAQDTNQSEEEKESPTSQKEQSELPPEVKNLIANDKPDPEQISNWLNQQLQQSGNSDLQVPKEQVEKELNNASNWKDLVKEWGNTMPEGTQQEENQSGGQIKDDKSEAENNQENNQQPPESIPPEVREEANDSYLGELIGMTFAPPSAENRIFPPASEIGVEPTIENLLWHQEWANVKFSERHEDSTVLKNFFKSIYSSHLATALSKWYSNPKSAEKNTQPETQMKETNITNDQTISEHQPKNIFRQILQNRKKKK